jgi:hypothetical protein
MKPDTFTPRTERTEKFYRASMIDGLIELVKILNPSIVYDAKNLKYPDLVIYVRDCLILEAGEVTGKVNEPPPLELK